MLLCARMSQDSDRLVGGIMGDGEMGSQNSMMNELGAEDARRC